MSARLKQAVNSKDHIQGNASATVELGRRVTDAIFEKPVEAEIICNIISETGCTLQSCFC